MSEPLNIIAGNPGFLGGPDYPHEFSADVSLELVYINLAPSDTRASLILRATNVEAPHSEIGVGVELTRDDLLWLAGCANVMAEAAKEDEDE